MLAAPATTSNLSTLDPDPDITRNNRLRVYTCTAERRVAAERQGAAQRQVVSLRGGLRVAVFNIDLESQAINLREESAIVDFLDGL